MRSPYLRRVSACSVELVVLGCRFIRPGSDQHRGRSATIPPALSLPSLDGYRQVEPLLFGASFLGIPEKDPYISSTIVLVIFRPGSSQLATKYRPLEKIDSRGVRKSTSLLPLSRTTNAAEWRRNWLRIFDRTTGGRG